MCNVMDIVLNQTFFFFFCENDWNQLCLEIFIPGLKTRLEVSAPKLMTGVKLGQKVFWNQELKNTDVSM
jgi:hypothetical protein